jgi:hypothetical protein
MLKTLLVLVIVVLAVAVLSGSCKFDSWTNGYWKDWSFSCKAASPFGRIMPVKDNPYMKGQQ